MRLLVTIAWRNIKRHRGKSIVVGIIIFLGALLMTVGNGVITGMDRGLRENIMNRFTGNIVVVSKDQLDDNVIFIPMGKSLELIAEYERVKGVLDSQDYIARYLPLCRGMTLVLDEEGDMGFALLLGVDFEEYQEMFNRNVLLVEGELLKKGDRGILITEDRRIDMYDQQDYWVKPEGYPLNEKNLTEEARKHRDELSVRESIVIMGSGDDNFASDISTPVRGIIKYEYLGDYWKYFNIIDLESYREAFRYVTGADAEVRLSSEKQKILASDNLDSMFGDSVVVGADTGQKTYNAAAMVARKDSGRKVEVDSGAYNLVFIKLKNPRNIDGAVERLNKALLAAKAPARAISWKRASGQLGDMATIIRGALHVFVFFIFFVAIIIIMNTLSMAAMERVPEIGMMRAVGAQKSFIGGMFVIETSILSLLFGGAGIVVGFAVILSLDAMGITTTNHILQLLFGGSVFRPVIEGWDIALGIVELALVTWLATLYPVRVARRITPLEAVVRD